MLMDLIPLAGGAIFGGVLKLIAVSMENKRVQQQMIISLSQKRQENINQANEMANTNAGFAWTRRIIALSLVVMIGSVIFGPMFFPDIPVNVIATATEGGSYLFGLIDTTTTKEIWITLKGIVLLPVIQDSMMAVTGTYFGASIAGRS